MHVLNARTQISKALDIRAIMGLQDVRAGSAVNVCKACRQTATVQRQHYSPLAWHCYSVKRLNTTAPHC
jgi:hypothetical protein